MGWLKRRKAKRKDQLPETFDYNTVVFWDPVSESHLHTYSDKCEKARCKGHLPGCAFIPEDKQKRQEE